MSLDGFLHDVEALHAGHVTSPRTPMRLRWRREWGGAIQRGDLGASTITVWLYPADADPRTRATWRSQLESRLDIERVEQGARCVVIGELAPGRGVGVNTGGIGGMLVTTYPLSRPWRGPRLGERS